MNIMLYRWQACGERRLIDNLRALGHRVDVSGLTLSDYDVDPKFSYRFMLEMEKNNSEAVFSFNYFPVISEVCSAKGVRYISWVFDNPHFTLFSRTVYNDCNAIFLFDRDMYAMYTVEYKVPTVRYLPLASDGEHFKEILRKCPEEESEKFKAQVSFVGSLYTGNQLGGLPKGLPEYDHGYLDGVIDSQLKLYGVHMIAELMKGDTAARMMRYFPQRLGENYYASYDRILTAVADRRAAAIERERLISAVAARFPLTVYTDSDTSRLPNVENRGYVDYYTDMPKVFRYSRINLNITARSITSGINLRALDIMACGGFMLVNYQPEIAEYFENGREVVMYGSEQEMTDLIGYYLEHEDERRKIAENGCGKVRERFSYPVMLRRMFEILKQF